MCETQVVIPILYLLFTVNRTLDCWWYEKPFSCWPLKPSSGLGNLMVLALVKTLLWPIALVVDVLWYLFYKVVDSK